MQQVCRMSTFKWWYLGYILTKTHILLMFKQKNFWYLCLCCLQESNTAYLPWIPGNHGNCMWINSLHEGSGIITPLLKVRRAGRQYSLIICRAVSEQMYQREKSDYLLVMSHCSVIIWEEECKPQGERETDGPISNCCSSVFRLCATSMVSCLWSKQSN